MHYRLVGANEHPGELINQDIALCLRDKSTTLPYYMNLTPCGLIGMGELRKALRQLKIQQDVPCGIGDSRGPQLYTLVVIVLKRDLAINSNIGGGVVGDWIGCLNARTISASFARKLRCCYPYFEKVGRDL